MLKRICIIIFFAMAVSGFISAQDSAKHQVGDKFGGGVVFYITPNGEHGLVSQTQDATVKPGHYNDDNFVFSMLDPYNYSQEAKDFADWRLPSMSELRMLYNHRDIVGGFLDNSYLSFYNTPVGLCALSFKTNRIDWVAQPLFNTISVRLVRSF